MLELDQQQGLSDKITPAAKSDAGDQYTIAPANNGDAMADRTWNAIDARLWDEYRLSKCARAVLAHVISLSPNPYGIYDPPPIGRILDWWDGIFSREQILAAFTELEDNGIGMRFRDGQCWWLIKKFKREARHFQSQKARDGIAVELAKWPEIANEFTRIHGYLVSENGIPSMIPSIIKRDTSESESESESEKKNKKKTTRSNITPSAPPPENCTKLAQRICDVLDKARADGLIVVNPRTVESLARFVERSGIDVQLLGKAWLWGWHDARGFWRAQMLNMASWSTAARWQTLVNQYQTQLGNGAQAANIPDEPSEPYAPPKPIQPGDTYTDDYGNIHTAGTEPPVPLDVKAAIQGLAARFTAEAHAPVEAVCSPVAAVNADDAIDAAEHAANEQRRATEAYLQEAI